jgi:hypothetical protein
MGADARRGAGANGRVVGAGKGDPVETGDLVGPVDHRSAILASRFAATSHSCRSRHDSESDRPFHQILHKRVTEVIH